MSDLRQVTRSLKPDQPPSTMGRRFSRGLLFQGIIWAIFLLFIEMLLRLFVPAPSREYHPWFGTHTRGGTSLRYKSGIDDSEFDQIVQYNREGFHDVEHVTSKRKGDVRVVILGDSIVEAREVALEENFCRVLESQLNHSSSSFPDNRYELVNLGVSGAGPLLASLMYRHADTGKDADLVLMCCFPNDLSDDVRFHDSVERDRRGWAYRIPTSSGIVPIPLWSKHFLRTQTRTWPYLGSRIQRAVQVIKGQALPISAPDPFRDLLIAARDGQTDHLDEAWKKLKANLGNLQALVRQRGAGFGLIAVPLGHQILTRPEWETGRKRYGLRRGSGGDFQARLREFALRKGIPFLDLRSSFESAQATSLFFPYDGHLTTEGHRVAADAIGEWLLEEKLINVSE